MVGCAAGDLVLAVIVVLRPAAIADIRAAREHYDQARPGLGEDLATDLDRLFARLEAFPRSAPLVADYEPVRRARLRRFPYAVFYRPEEPEEKQIEILRVIHTARSPEAWRGPG
jgi:plasmid stabilization system protein ParE